MKRILLILLIVVAGSCFGLDRRTESEIISQVAHEYELDKDQIRMMFAIRRHENGGLGLEFGVADDQPGHRARRGKTPKTSFLIQARWTAGTLKSHWGKSSDSPGGAIAAFAKVWCPADHVAWAKSIKSILKDIP